MKNDTQDILEALKKDKKNEFNLGLLGVLMSIFASMMLFVVFKEQIDKLLIAQEEIKTFDVIFIFTIGFCFCIFVGFSFLISIKFILIRYEFTNEKLTIILFEKIKEIEGKMNNEPNQNVPIGEGPSKQEEMGK